MAPIMINMTSTPNQNPEVRVKVAINFTKLQKILVIWMI